MNLQELRQKLAALCDKQQGIVSAAMTEARGITDEEKTQFDALQIQIDGMDNIIKLAEKMEARDEALKKPIDGGNGPNVEIKDRAAEKPWKSHGEFLQAVHAAGQPGAMADVRLRYMDAASGASVGVPSDGGFLVQKQWETALLSLTHEVGQLASKCRNIPIGDGADGLRMNAVDETSRVNGGRWGGIVVYRRAEADAATASKPKFRQISIDLEDVVGLCYATDRLLRDATALEAVITQGFAEEFAFKLDEEIFEGDGAGKCLGFTNTPALVSVSKEVGQAAKSIVTKNLSKMWARFWPRSRANGIWFINADIEPQLDELAIIAGTGALEPRFVTYGPEGTLRIKGRPVVAIEHCKTLGTVGDIVLADLSQYLLIDKGAVQSASSIHVRFLYGENTFRFTYSVNGQPIWNSPMTPKNGTDTLSPFVALATRG